MTRAQWEYAAATLIIIVLLAYLIPSILAARTAVRDDLRRQDIAHLKHALEFYFNEHNHYGSPPDTQECTHGSDPNSWLFGDTSPLLKGQHIDAIPHDTREWRGHEYVFCATDVVEGTTRGYYFQAQLEVEQADVRAFDEDEQRKFDYRVLHENGDIFYRVCGGTERQCQPER